MDEYIGTIAEQILRQYARRLSQVGLAVGCSERDALLGAVEQGMKDAGLAYHIHAVVDDSGELYTAKRASTNSVNAVTKEIIEDYEDQTEEIFDMDNLQVTLGFNIPYDMTRGVKTSLMPMKINEVAS